MTILKRTKNWNLIGTARLSIVQRMRKAGIGCELFIDPREMASDATAFGQARLRFATASPCLSRHFLKDKVRTQDYDSRQNDDD